jgi:hypothetical protein
LSDEDSMVLNHGYFLFSHVVYGYRLAESDSNLDCTCLVLRPL